MLPTKQPIKRAKTADEALTALMRLCARAERSSGDALRLMAQWGVAEVERKRVLERLLKERFIDDSRYAEAFVREKCNLSAWGVYKIQSALRRKGIADSIIKEALTQLSPEKNLARLQERLERKMRSIKYNTNYELRTKLVRYGLSLGFTMEEVVEAVNQTTKNREIEQCDDYLF